MVKRTILAVLCLSVFLMCFSETAHSFEAMYECYEQLLQEFPNVEAIKKRFENTAEWHVETVPSPHDADLKLRIDSMVNPGIEISTLGYTLEGEDYYFLILMDVKESGFVKFGGIDLGSASEDVIEAFGPPQQVDGNELLYYDESEYMVIKFILEEEIVVGMVLNNYLD